MKILLTTFAPELISAAQDLARELHLSYCDSVNANTVVKLVLTHDHLELHVTQKPKINPIYVDFTAGKLQHRRQFGGGRGQLIARACGFSKLSQPTLLDLTAGLGQDAFVLASLGAKVTLIERSPILAALLRDGIQRAQQQEWFRHLFFNFVEMDALHYLQQLKTSVDVIYLDPMFPAKTKSALVKKEMRVLRQLVGDDVDAKLLLPLALQKATHRVVVKRASLAPTLDDRKPDIVYAGKSSRFDVYDCHNKVSSC